MVQTDLAILYVHRFSNLVIFNQNRTSDLHLIKQESERKDRSVLCKDTECVAPERLLPWQRPEQNVISLVGHKLLPHGTRTL